MTRSAGQLAFYALVFCIGCDRMPADKCGELRSQAFDIINGSHTCMEDADCTVSHWPGCPKPINLKTEAHVEELREQFRAGRCESTVPSCKTPPGAFCDRNFCILRTRSGGGASAPSATPR
jgi:hypothetical protein